MMRGRLQPASERDPHAKRARVGEGEEQEEQEEEGSDARVRAAMEEEYRALVTLTEERRSEVRQLEELSRAVHLKLAEAGKNLTDAEGQLARIQNYFQFNAGISNDAFIKVKTESKVEPDTKGNVAGPSSICVLTSLKREMPDERIIAGLVKSNNMTPLYSRSSNTAHTKSDVSETSQNVPKDCKMLDLQADSVTSPESKLQGEGCKEHRDLVAQVCGNYAPGFLNMGNPIYIASHHKRKLRSLVVNPFEDKICATSALDGIINIWKVGGNGIGLSRITTLECLSPQQRRWPEDMAWDPTGDKLIACYTADGKDNQVAIINPSSKRVEFLEDKPHEKGIINSISFMPWCGGLMFATGGCDHGVVMWTEKVKGVGWTPRLLHRCLHSSAVMGITGMVHKQWVLSAGIDKRIVGYDVSGATAVFRQQLESKAMAVLSNPVDFNMFMIQTGARGRQLSLFDMRVKPSELHTFGWIQESSESQSALISQTWSPDGLYIASGSADPKIHIFDIRYNSKEPSQTVKAHQKRVLKAAWHHKIPLIISISSDLNIGLHRFIF